MKRIKKQNSCFVLMPFRKPFNNYYEDIIKPAIKKSGLSPFRADEIKSTRPFIDDITESIKKSKVILAEITGRNPNVMFEIGFAYAFKKPIVMISQSVNEAPDDIMHHKIILYKTTEPKWADTLKSEITEVILEVIKEKEEKSKK